jgi:hypothetical protein
MSPVGSIISDIGLANIENLSEPIVSSLNTNMSSVVTLLSQIAKSVGVSNNVPDGRLSNYVASRQASTSNHEDHTNATVITNYQKVGA